MSANQKYIELHTHLDGSITLEIAKELAEIQKKDLSHYTDEQLIQLIRAPKNCTDLNDFLKCFDFPVSLMQTKESIKKAVCLVLDNMKNDGVLYAEIIFAPQNHTKCGLTQQEAVIAAIDGLNKSDIYANLLLCFMRGNGNEKQNLITLNTARKFITDSGGVTGVNLAGAEAVYPTHKYGELFAEVKKSKIPFTIHAGEADGAKSVKDAINFGASRIGHGVRIFEDENVVNLVKNNNITLEMCPTSNRITRAVDDMNKYPFMNYLNRGLKVTINSDDPAIENTTLSKEFLYMKNKFGLTDSQQQTVTYNALNAAFTSDTTKKHLKKLLNCDVATNG